MSLPFVRDTSRTAASIGQVKSDRRPNAILDPKFDVDMDEYNELLDAVQEVTHYSPLNKTRFNSFDDFDALRIGTDQPWLQTLANGGTQAILTALTAPVEGEGLGWLRLATTSTGGSASSLVGRGDLISPVSHPVVRCRVKLPADLAAAEFHFGLESAAQTTFLELGTPGAEWVMQSASLTGGGGGDLLALVTPVPVAATTYDLRIELTSGVEAKFYIDDVLVGTFSPTNDVPLAGDVLNPFLRVLRVAGGGSADVDFIHVTGDR